MTIRKGSLVILDILREEVFSTKIILEYRAPLKTKKFV